MKVVYIAPQEEAVIKEVPDLKLSTMQGLVGGLIELVYLEDDGKRPICLWLNERGLLESLAPNRYLPGVGPLVGPLFITASKNSKTVGLTDAECETWLAIVGRWPMVKWIEE